MIHLRLNTIPALHIIGVYLDCAPTVEQATKVQARLEAKLEEITNKDENVLLMGDLNRPMDKPTEHQKTRIIKSWIDTGKVILLNDPKEHTRIDPVTGRGSTLDLGIVNPSLMEKVTHFKVDTHRRWSLHGTITSKSTGRTKIGKWSDHKGIECKLKVTILAATKAGNSPVINYGAEGGWVRYHTISNRRAPDVVKLIDAHNDVDLRQNALNLLKLEIDIEAFGIRFRPKGISHKKQTKRKQSHLQNLEDIIKEENATLKAEYIELTKIKDPTAKIWKIRTSVLGPKNKNQEPTCINHPATGELITNPEDIKKISLEHNLQILKKNKARPEDKELHEQKMVTHKMIMESDNKDKD